LSALAATAVKVPPRQPKLLGRDAGAETFVVPLLALVILAQELLALSGEVKFSIEKTVLVVR
jgi:hypothetical protein